MSRDLGAALEGEIEQSVVRPFFALYIALPDPVAVWTGIGELTFGGRTWLGAGGIGSLDFAGEATDGSATGVRATLLQIPSEFREDIADQATRGVSMEVWFGALNQDMQTLVGTERIWTGRLDTYEIADSGEFIDVTVTGESRARDQQRPAIKRFTDEYQQRQYPGDKFFEYLPQMAEVSILWAKEELSGASKVAVSRGGFAPAFADTAAAAARR